MKLFFLEKIQLKNFRNIKDGLIELGPNINCFFGYNNNGKTNLLESIFILLNKKTIKKQTKFNQLISIGSDYSFFSISAKIKFDKYNYLFSTQWEDLGPKWFVDNKKEKVIDSPFISSIISPSDFYNYYSSVDFRRDWFNHYFSHYSIEYKKKMSLYTKTLKQKNLLIKSENNRDNSNVIKSFNSIMAKLIFEIVTLRTDFVALINEYLSKYFIDLFDDNYKLELSYTTKFNQISEPEINKFLNDSLNQELTVKRCLHGIHKDDFVILINGLDIREFGSMGQQKMAYLSLLFAYIDVFRYKFNLHPIILLDDISNEIDEVRHKKLIDFFKVRKAQTIITTSNYSFVNLIKGDENVKLHEIKSGHVFSYSDQSHYNTSENIRD